MYCSKCGAHLRDHYTFCPSCGAPAFRPAQPELPPFPNADEIKAGPSQKKRNVKKAVLIASFCAAAVVLAAVIIVILNACLYDHAMSIMDSDPLKAKAEFQSLGSYKESEDNAELCQNIYDYDTASEMMDSGDYEGALILFKQLGGYEDSAANAQECQNALDYTAAAQKMDSGDMQGALEIFLNLGGYSDSAQKSRECRNSLDYDTASGLMAKKDFSGAYDIFLRLGDYKDSLELAIECGNKKDYAQAAEYYDAGKYYSAYKLYMGLGDYLDSSERAAACVQPLPKTGRLYYDPDYNRDNRLVIKAPKDGYYTYIKIYTFNYVTLDNPGNRYKLVATVFLAPGKTVKIKLREVTMYIIKQAYGRAWYGPDEMFGDEGTYTVMMFNNNGEYSKYFWSDFREYYGRYYIYTLKLRQSKGNVEGTSESREDF